MALKIGINLVWLKPYKMGGVEYFAKNLLKGFASLEKNGEIDKNTIQFTLLVANTNRVYIERVVKNSNIFEIYNTKINSYKVAQRILWENVFLDKFMKNIGVDLVFIPIYSKPFFTRLPYIITIHDLQALHYPEYFSKIKNMWLRIAWKRSAQTAVKIVAISNFVKKDIIENLNIPSEKIKVIHNPVEVPNKFIDFNELRNKYRIEKNRYFYTVSSLLPHKNLITILKLIKSLKEKKFPIDKLVISGVKGKDEKRLKEYMKENGVENNVILTGFVADEERNTLYKNAYCFLFPSVFEGFGMPPVEAIELGTLVITTKETSIYEVTKGKAFYVDDPYDINQWMDRVFEVYENMNSKMNYKFHFNEYEPGNVAEKYLSLFQQTFAYLVKCQSHNN